MPRTAAVFFDVDFTLIHPGPRFQGVGYEANCARHGVAVDQAAFDAAVAGAASALDLEAADQIYDAQVFLNYTRRIIELMGGRGPGVERVCREMYDDWAEHHHFSLYDDVAATLGYADVSPFMRTFRRWAGTTPGQWRRAAALARLSRDAFGVDPEQRQQRFDEGTAGPRAA